MAYKGHPTLKTNIEYLTDYDVADYGVTIFLADGRSLFLSAKFKEQYEKWKGYAWQGPGKYHVSCAINASGKSWSSQKYFYSVRKLSAEAAAVDEINKELPDGITLVTLHRGSNRKGRSYGEDIDYNKYIGCIHRSRTEESSKDTNCAYSSTTIVLYADNKSEDDAANAALTDSVIARFNELMDHFA